MKSVELQMARVTCLLGAIASALLFPLPLSSQANLGAFSELLWTESVASYRAPR
jgi:hypothetical protein